MRINHVLYIHKTSWPIRGAKPEPVLAMRTDKAAFGWLERLKGGDGVGNANLRQIQQGNFVYWAVPDKFEKHVLDLAQEHFVEIMQDPYPISPVEETEVKRAKQMTSDAGPYEWKAKVVEVGEYSGIGTSGSTRGARAVMTTESGKQVGLEVDKDQARWFAQHLYQWVVVSVRAADDNEAPGD